MIDLDVSTIDHFTIHPDSRLYNVLIMVIYCLSLWVCEGHYLDGTALVRSTNLVTSPRLELVFCGYVLYLLHTYVTVIL